MVRSQLCNRAIVARCFAAGGSGIGLSGECVEGSPLERDDREVAEMGVRILSDSRLVFSSEGFTSRFEDETSACGPVMRRLMPSASSS